jgi:toxin ParE1/3/4
MLLEWRSEAEEDLSEILLFITERNIQAAIDLQSSVERCIEHLTEHPFLFKPSQRKNGWREIVVHPNYIVFYMVTDKIYIMAVTHSRQQYPSADLSN